MPLPSVLHLVTEGDAARRVEDASRSYRGACTALEMALKTGRGTDEVDRRHAEWLRAAGIYYQTLATQGRGEVTAP